MADLKTVAAIENAIDKRQAGDIAMSFEQGGASFKSMAEIMEYAKLMSVASIAIPPHLRGNPGACLAICIQAVEWKMSPFSVANKSYVVNDRVSYESQLIHAVIEQRAPLVGRLRHEFIGNGLDRKCRVWANVKGEAEPLSFTSSRFADITPKNSPLWKTKPDLQLYYNASRDWARVFFPDIILGVYSNDELGTVVNERQPIAMPRALSEPIVEAAPVVVAKQDESAAEPLSSDTQAEIDVDTLFNDLSMCIGESGDSDTLNALLTKPEVQADFAAIRKAAPDAFANLNDLIESKHADFAKEAADPSGQMFNGDKEAGPHRRPARAAK